MVREDSYHQQLIVEKRKGEEVNTTELKDYCVKPARGRLVPEAEFSIPAIGIARSQEVNQMSARVGKELKWIQRRRLE
jgi:hypothetical protein